MGPTTNSPTHPPTHPPTTHSPTYAYPTKDAGVVAMLLVSELSAFVTAHGRVGLNLMRHAATTYYYVTTYLLLLTTTYYY